MTMTTTPSDDPSEIDRYVFVEKVRCPRCGDCDLQITRSKTQEDSSVCRTANCRTCRHHFFIIEE